MSLNSTNFEQADYIDGSALPGAPIEPDTNLLARAVLFGLAGALAGAIIYVLFVSITHISIGYLALLVGYLVAKAMTIGSKGRGGRKYQVAAVVLTYLAVAAAHCMLLWWFLHDKSTTWTPHLLTAFVKYGLMFPALGFMGYVRGSLGRGLLDLVILFVGLRAAWRMTSGIPGAVRHPFSR